VVRSRREGSNVYYSLRDPRLLDALNNMKAVLSDILNDSRATAVRKRVGRV
jgi:DNA-binding transcriptional ArsR family regulator